MIDDLILPFIPHQGPYLSSGRTLAILKVLTDLQKTMPAGLFGDFIFLKKGLISHDFDLWIRKEVQSCRAFWVQMRDFNSTSDSTYFKWDVWQPSLSFVRGNSGKPPEEKFTEDPVYINMTVHPVIQSGLTFSEMYKNGMMMVLVSCFSLFPVPLTSDTSKGGWCRGLICKCGDVKLKGSWIPTGLGCSPVHHRKCVPDACCSLSCNFIGAQSICKIKFYCSTQLMC